MWQTLFHIPFLHIPVYGYGVMLVIGFVCGMYLAQFLARRSGLNPDLFANACILALVTGVIGARLSHVLENLPEYTNANLSAGQNLLNAINIREGGLTYYGGFLLAFPALVLYAIWKRVPLPLGMDIIAPCLMIGLAFGRIGCFLNGCCYGAQCNVPWAAEFPYGSDAYVTQFNQNQLKSAVPIALVKEDSPLWNYMKSRGLDTFQEPVADPVALQVADARMLKSKDEVRADPELAKTAARQRADPVHPAEIYSAITAFLIAGFLVCYFTLPHVSGHVFAAMMMIEGVFRYLLEMLRVEPAVVGRGTGHLTTLPPQSYSMVVSFFLVTIGAILWFVFSHVARSKGGTIGAGRRTPVMG